MHVFVCICSYVDADDFSESERGSKKHAQSDKAHATALRAASIKRRCT
jgi:hypothetical protein